MQTQITYNKSNNFISVLIVFFPLVNITVAYLQRGDGLLTLYLGYSFIIFFTAYLQSYFRQGTHVKKHHVYIIMMLLIETLLVYSVAQRISFLLEFSTYAFCIIYWLVFSNKERINSFSIFLMKQKKAIIVIQLLYFVVLFLSVINGDGMSQERWGTITLKGPYFINHLLSYELLMFLMINLIVWIRENTLFSAVLTIVDFGLIALTGVRGVLIAVVLVVFLTFLTQKPQKQLLLGIAAVLILAYMFYRTNIFVAISEKTQNAIAIGSASNGRGSIFLSSIRAYLEANNPLNWLAGIGYDSLLDYNRSHILMRIHAHNDFIDALAQYGLIGLILYVWTLIEFLSSYNKKVTVIGMMIIIALAGFNGFFMYQTAVVMCPVIIVFVSNINVHSKKIGKDV